MIIVRSVSDLVRLRLLLVEDSETDAFLILRALKSGGYDVEHRRVCTAADLAVAFGDGEWDAVISDFAMPGFSGTAALAMFKEQKLDVPFLIVSGTIGEEDAVAAMRAGAHDYLLKDRLARLAPTLDRELREAQMRRAARAADAAARDAQRKQEEAEAANRAKTMFLANVSHELRTPLNAIIGFSELLTYDGSELGQSLSPQQREYMRHVLASGRHLLMLVDDLLDLAKIDSGKMMLARVSTGVDAVTDGVLEVIEPLAKKKGLHLDVAMPHDLPQIFADPLRLRQILYNLLSNAIKFTESGGTVRLGVEARDDGVTISVRDTGVGIRREDMDRLFREFERLGAPEITEGSGLGLALTKKLVELHGGSISAVSAVGEGSTFTVFLPLAGDAPVILVVEPDGPSRRLARDVLAQRGYAVLEARDVDEALAVLRKNPTRLVIAETRIEGGGGARLLEEMRADASLAKIPIIATESDGAPRNPDFDDYLSKPIDTHRLGMVVDALLLRPLE